MADMPNTAAGAGVWRYWNDTNTSTTADATSTWGGWNSQYYLYTTSATANTTTDVWAYWTSAPTYRTYTQPQETDEERTARLQREEEQRTRYKAEQAQRERERKEAEARAKELLLLHLTAEQQESYEREQSFRVISADGERIYRIRRGRARNVELVNPQGKVIRRYCAHPVENVPDEDTVLAQKLMLETCEEEFLRLANVS